MTAEPAPSRPVFIKAKDFHSFVLWLYDDKYLPKGAPPIK